MKINNEGNIEFDKGEPALRSCFNCNGCHKHLMNVDFVHWCFQCGRYWIKGKYFDEFKNINELIDWLKENKLIN